MTHEQVHCPRCGGSAVPIVYGLAGPEILEASTRGELVPGGCCVDPLSPTHECSECGHSWLDALRDEA